MVMRNRSTKEAAVEHRGKGILRQMKGNVKEAVGEVTNDSRTRRSGKADRISGRVQEAVGDALDRVPRGRGRKV